MNIDVEIEASPAARLPSVKKLVITTFLSSFSGSDAVSFLELAADGPINFRISANTSEELTCSPEMYLDEHASRQMYSRYKLLNPATGRHSQRIGEDELTISPVHARLHLVSGRGRSTFNSTFAIDIPETPVEGDLPGTWFVMRHQVNGESTQPKARLDCSLEARGIDIQNLYWFVVLPDGYRLDSGQFMRRHKSLPIGEPSQDMALNEFEVPRTFAVYPEWKNIYNRRILKNRESASVEGNMVASISAKLVSDIKLSQVSNMVFLAGVLNALTVGLATNGIFYLLEKQTQSAAIFAAVLCAIAILCVGITWRAVFKQ